MLSLHDVSLISPNGNYILSGVSTIFPKSHICAIVGPSGCGKTSLIKTIAGIGPGFEKGLIYWNQQNLNEKDFSPTDLGYVPQFNITYPQLTARESVFFSLKLKLSAS
ncbi:MAG: ABC transporter ATP-binding protein, partial [Chthoniobacterales bacterium]|nr:ABC transporter ATP-binding protein [Chthoniobacterales bacterium]